jgi:methylated-DNA-[protein]-cysteine S-methyltransferase
VDDDPLLVEAARQLTAYFAGELQEFDLPLRPGGTAFQERVWAELRRVGYGQTATYGELAERLGLSKGASRAVGAANGRNPIGIVIPCHRVVGAAGSMSGYAGGVERKRLLLGLEQESLF